MQLGTEPSTRLYVDNMVLVMQTATLGQCKKRNQAKVPRPPRSETSRGERLGRSNEVSRPSRRPPSLPAAGQRGAYARPVSKQQARVYRGENARQGVRY